MNKFVPMSNGVREFLLNGLSDADKALATRIITDAETKQLTEYEIKLSKRWFKIVNGQIAGSAVE